MQRVVLQALLVATLAAWPAFSQMQLVYYNATGRKTLLAPPATGPSGLPTLGVWQVPTIDDASRICTMVSTTFPEVPQLTCDSWCYENSSLNFIDVQQLDKGALLLRHRDQGNPNLMIVTVVRPEQGAVDIEARAMPIDPLGKLPHELPGLGLCFQLTNAPTFTSQPDPYPDFIKRGFIYTTKGITFLGETARSPLPHFPPEHSRNNPPWVQSYLGDWVDASKPQAATSSDRVVSRVIGVVSRDRKYFVALGNGTGDAFQQYWHDCLHADAKWAPADAPPEKRVWRLKIYAGSYDPKGLLKRLATDFPGTGVR